MPSNVELSIVNNAGSTSALANPYISIFGTVAGTGTVNFSIQNDGTCKPDPSGTGQDVIKFSSLTGPLKLDSGLSVTGGRIYFSTSSAVVTNNTQPAASSAAFYYDFVEFALNSGASNQLVVDTTQVDQFGFPIKLEVNPPDTNFGAFAGTELDRATLISSFQSFLPAGSPYLDCVFPSGSPIYRLLNPNQAIVAKPSSGLTSYFTNYLDAFFTYYTTHTLYLNSDGGYPYKGNVTTVNIGGHDYSVLQFTFASNAPTPAGLPTTPPEGTGPYNIYYPFFTTNNPGGHSSFNGQTIPPPPSWWNITIPGAGSLTPTESPSQMVFAGNGVFADDLFQYNISSPTPQANVLGNLENQVATALNRGHAINWKTLTGSIAPSGNTPDPITHLYTSTITLGTTSYTDQNLPNTTAGLKVGMNVISFGDSQPMNISAIGVDGVTLTVTSLLPILAQNPAYLTFADFYADGTYNTFARFFHDSKVSVGGRAYAFSFDDQGGFSSTLTSNWGGGTPTKATITLGPWLPAVVVGKSVLITGTNGSDNILVEASGLSSFKVVVNNKVQGTFDALGPIIISGLAGNDFIKVADSITRSTIIFGGEGDDCLGAGGGPTVLVGGGGKDVLKGGVGRNILIGGAGADLLSGNNRDDILVGGATSYDDSSAKLNAILTTWNSAATFAARTAALSKVLNSSTVFDDDKTDVIGTRAGRDWVFADQHDFISDLSIDDLRVRIQAAALALAQQHKPGKP